jgi:hypothetical protein
MKALNIINTSMNYINILTFSYGCWNLQYLPQDKKDVKTNFMKRHLTKHSAPMYL